MERLLTSQPARVVEPVDAPDSKSGSARSVGSIPTARTTFTVLFAKVAGESSNPFQAVTRPGLFVIDAWLVSDGSTIMPLR